MRISTLLKTSVSAAILMVLGLAVANWSIRASLAEVMLTQERAQDTERDISSLLVLTHEYALYSEERASQQWKVIQSDILKKLEASSNDQVPAPAEALLQAKLLPELFKQLDTALSNKSDLQNRQRNLLLNQLHGSSQVLADSVHRWSYTVSKHLNDTEQKFRLLSLIIPILMLFILLLLAFIFNRRVLRPLTQLNQAVSAVAKGDLTVRSATEYDDELGELSRTFDAMAIDLVSELKKEIAERKQAEAEREVALASIKKLQGIIPICMHCKKIRDDKNSWNQLEQYITAHSEALFSHGICPHCAEEQMEIIRNLKK
jgi:nitrate/nitrite-specific signal transduction histidine kinase